MKFEQSKTEGNHAQLAKLVGQWKGVARVWFGPELADESPVEATIKPLMDGKYLLHEYTGAFKDKPLTGITLIGFDLTFNRYQAAWIDSFHTATFIMFSESEKNASQMTVHGGYDYVTPEEQQYWRWRTEIELKDDQTLVFTAYNISPAGEEWKATEAMYQRS